MLSKAIESTIPNSTTLFTISYPYSPSHMIYHIIYPYSAWLLATIDHYQPLSTALL